MTYLSDELYKTITDSVPMVCVDVIPVRTTAGAWEIGIITRATGSEVGMATLIGGRVQHDETLRAAISRHIETDLGITAYEFFADNDELRPFRVQQYLHTTVAEDPFGYDPSKHSVAATFLITLTDDPKPKNEASAFHWVSRDAIPEHCGYNQAIVMRAAFDFLSTSGS